MYSFFFCYEFVLFFCFIIKLLFIYYQLKTLFYGIFFLLLVLLRFFSIRNKLVFNFKTYWLDRNNILWSKKKNKKIK